MFPAPSDVSSSDAQEFDHMGCDKRICIWDRPCYRFLYLWSDTSALCYTVIVTGFLFGCGFFLVPSSGFLKPFDATISKETHAYVHLLSCSLGFRHLKIHYCLLEDLVNSKNSFLIFLQKVLVTV